MTVLACGHNRVQEEFVLAGKHIEEWQRIVGARPDRDFGPDTLARSKAKLVEAAHGGKVDFQPKLYTQQPWSFPDPERLAREATPRLHRFILELARRSRFKFGAYEVLRSRATQEEYIRTGVSWTMNTLHFPQADGLAHAADLVWLNDKGHWDWSNAEQYRYLAELGMDVAADLGIPIRNLGLAIGRDWYHFEIERGK